MTFNLSELQALCLKRTDRLFDSYLRKSPVLAPSLQTAMAYLVLNEGKRFRSLLVYLTGSTLDASWENLDAPAAAIELIHAYSLIHDDLPAMDNSALRRGKPTCHKVYGEATAILAGDALQTLAFEILADYPAAHLSPLQRNRMIACLAKASGFQGMAAGQMLDLLGPTSLSAITDMYLLKTGTLLSTSVELGMIAANLQNETMEHALRHFAYSIGLAYQLQDDLLDIEGETAIIGKTQGLDGINKKITYASLVGMDQTKQKANELFDSAIKSAQSLGEKGNNLLNLATLIRQRKL
jgi:geranylgeranyl pyrophosphate synthase